MPLGGAAHPNRTIAGIQRPGGPGAAETAVGPPEPYLYVGACRVSNNMWAQFGLEGGSRAIPNRGRDSDTTAMGVGIRTTF
jgi:hypothetical protein